MRFFVQQSPLLTSCCRTASTPSLHRLVRPLPQPFSSASAKRAIRTASVQITTPWPTYWQLLFEVIISSPPMHPAPFSTRETNELRRDAFGRLIPPVPLSIDMMRIYKDGFKVEQQHALDQKTFAETLIRLGAKLNDPVSDYIAFLFREVQTPCLHLTDRVSGHNMHTYKIGLLLTETMKEMLPGLGKTMWRGSMVETKPRSILNMRADLRFRLGPKLGLGIDFEGIRPSVGMKNMPVLQAHADAAWEQGMVVGDLSSLEKNNDDVSYDLLVRAICASLGNGLGHERRKGPYIYVVIGDSFEATPLQVFDRPKGAPRVVVIGPTTQYQASSPTLLFEWAQRLITSDHRGLLSERARSDLGIELPQSKK